MSDPWDEKPTDPWDTPAPQPGDPSFWSKVGDLGLGAVQGATSNFGDELGAGSEAIVDSLRGDPRSFSDIYRQNKQSINTQFYDKAKWRSPWLYGGGQMVGGMPAAMALPGATGAMAQGSANMLGMGDYSGDVKGAGHAITDASMGAIMGLVGMGAGQLVGPALNRGWQYGKQALGYGMQAPQVAMDIAADKVGGFVSDNITEALTPDKPQFGKLASVITRGASRELETANNALGGQAGAAAQKVADELGNAANKSFTQLSDLEKQRLYSAYASGMKERGLPISTDKAAETLGETLASNPDMAALSVKQIVRELNKRDMQYALRLLEGVDNNFGATARSVGIPLNPSYEQAATSARQASGDFMAGKVNRMQVPMNTGAQPGVAQNSVQTMQNVAGAIPMEGPATVVQPASGAFSDWAADGASRASAKQSAQNEAEAAARKPWLDMAAKAEKKLGNIGTGRNVFKLGGSLLGGGVGALGGAVGALSGVGAGSSATFAMDATGALGQKLVESGKMGLTPAKLTSAWLESPSILQAMSKMQSPVGRVAGEAYQALQERGVEGLKSRLFTLQAEPWARKALVSEPDENDKAIQAP